MNLMFLLYIASTAGVAIGLYLILAGLFHLPTFATTKAAMNITKHSDKKVKKWDEVLLDISSQISKFIYIDSYKLKNLTSTLKNAEISIPPQTWLARCYVKFAFSLLTLVPCYFVIPILSPAVAVLAIRQLLIDLKSADKIVSNRRHEIEKDLPRFASSISQELKNTRNVLAILEGYKSSARPAFRKELLITIGDMKSGSQEVALNHLDSRVGSSMLSDVVRGLLGVLHGDDESNYFDILSHDLDLMEIHGMRLNYAKLPGKVGTCIGAVFACIMLIIFVILGTQLSKSAAFFNM